MNALRSSQHQALRTRSMDMHTANYIYAFREGTTAVFCAEASPTMLDVEAVRSGTITIIRLSDLHSLAGDGIWHPIESGALTTPTVDGRPFGPFHMPRSMLQ